MKKALLVLLAVALMPSLAEAHSNGGKSSNSKVRFKNESGGSVAVIANPSDAALNASTPAEFEAEGGKILGPGESVDFSVKAGSTRVVAALVGPNGITGVPADRTVTLRKGKTTKFRVTNNGGNARLTIF